ncbi:MAG: RDD family protein [Actinomycetota bacterium]
MSDVPPGTPPTPGEQPAPSLPPRPGAMPPASPGAPPSVAPEVPPTPAAPSPAPPAPAPSPPGAVPPQPGAAPPPPGAAPPPPPGPPGAPPGTPPPGYGAPPPSFGQAAPEGYQSFQPVGGPGPGGTPAAQFGEIAGFGARFGGWLLDSLLYGLLALVFVIPGVIVAFNDIDSNCVSFDDELLCNGEEGTGILAGLGLIGIGVIVVAVIYLRALARTGQTWGRKIVGIKVIKEQEGTPPGWGKAIGRQLFASFISAQILYLGYLWAIWDGKKQTWHDKVAGTHVIRAR